MIAITGDHYKGHLKDCPTITVEFLNFVDSKDIERNTSPWQPSSSASTYLTAAPRQSPWSTNLMRITTALAAVVGIWAMAAQEASSQTTALADGVYLYGESAVSNTVGATYFVFEVDGET